MSRPQEDLVLVALAARSVGPWSWKRFHHLAQALVPLAGCGVFLGLSALTVSMLRADGLAVHWAREARAALLAGAWTWSLWLAYGILRRESVSLPRIALATTAMAFAGVAAASSWVLLFWAP